MSEQITVTIVAVKGPTEVGKSKKWDVLTKEDLPYDLMVWASDGAEDLKKYEYEKVEITVEPSKDRDGNTRTYNNTEQWRVIKTPAWENKPGGGGGGWGRQVDEQSIIAQVILKCSVELACANGGDVGMVDKVAISLVETYQNVYNELKAPKPVEKADD